MIEKYFHARESVHGQTRFCKFQYSFDLISLYAWKPFEKIVDSGATFEVFKKRANGNASVFKNPRSADLFWTAFHDRAIIPVEHENRIRQGRPVSKITG